MMQKFLTNISSSNRLLIVGLMVALSLITVATALFQRFRSGPLAPTAPTSKPAAFEITNQDSCTYSFDILEPEITPVTITPTSEITTTIFPSETPIQPTATLTDSPIPTLTDAPTLTLTDIPTHTPTQILSSTPSNTPLATATETPTSPTATFNPSDTVTSTPPGLPKAGNDTPTIIFIGLGITVIVLGILAIFLLL